MNVTIITPRIAVQKGDFLGSGIPYWPLEAAILASHARGQGDHVQLFDLFGMNPERLTDQGDHYLQGVPVTDALKGVEEPDLLVVFALSYMSHQEVLKIGTYLAKTYPKAKLVALENSQAVTSYSLEDVKSAFFEAGYHGLICGEAYFNWDAVRAWAMGRSAERPVNLITPEGQGIERLLEKNATYPVPAWDLVNLKAYWGLPYSHGPKTKRFLPIFTSRGCPYPCDFCVVPTTNNKRWRPRPADEVVDEMIQMRDQFGVRDFQIEDLNPTVKGQRMRDICERLIARKAGIRFYIVSGTKAETIPIEDVPLMAQAGCRYISISPESGSKRLMKIIGKRFNYEHGLELAKACRKSGIRTQACFLVGHPDETAEDYQETRSYMTKLLRHKLDEVAVFIVAPFAGSALYQRESIDLGDQNALPSFSPKGRKNFEILEQRRSELIRLFFSEKLRAGFDIWMQGLRSLFGTPQTKMENLPKRMIYLYWLVLKNRWFQRSAS
ncbi:MAG: hypothetical protein CL675_02935 [Bdellovibrionaceae bacterium]|nr:hypothetical protein [Pseudobdellovibrionaceae bacterium]